MHISSLATQQPPRVVLFRVECGLFAHCSTPDDDSHVIGICGFLSAQTILYMRFVALNDDYGFRLTYRRMYSMGRILASINMLLICLLAGCKYFAILLDSGRAPPTIHPLVCYIAISFGLPRFRRYKNGVIYMNTVVNLVLSSLPGTKTVPSVLRRRTQSFVDIMTMRYSTNAK